MLANILTVTATTRYLGPDSYGALTTAIVFVGLWTSMTELGIGSVIVRKVMSGDGSLERLVRTNAGMSLAYSFPLFVVAALSGFMVYRDNSEVVEMILIISVGLILTTISSCFQPVFIATLRFTSVGVSDFASRLASLLLTLAVIERDAGLEWFAVVQITPAVVVLLIQGVAASRIVNCRPIFAMRDSWHLLRESLPQTAVLVIGVLYWRVDGVILSLRSTQEEVGVYGLAYTLAFTISVLPGFFGTSTLSAMSHLYATNRVRFSKFVAGSVESMFFVGLPIAAVGSISAAQIVELIGSAEFVGRGGPTLALLLAAASVGFITGVLSQALFAAHDQIFLLRLNIINLMGNIMLNFILTPLYGAIGAGIAMLASESIGLVVANWRLRRLTAYRTPWGTIFRLTIPVAASIAVVLLAAETSVLFAVPAAGMVYLAVNLVVGPVTLKRLRTLLPESRNADSSGSGSDSEAGGAR